MTRIWKTESPWKRFGFLLARMRFPKSSRRVSRANQERMKMRGAARESARVVLQRTRTAPSLPVVFYVHFRRWLVGLFVSALSGKLALVFLGFDHSEGKEWRGFFSPIIISIWIN